MSESTFEDKVKSIEDILSKLEQNDASLEASMELYQQGISLIAQCNSHLDTIEKTLIVIKE